MYLLILLLHSFVNVNGVAGVWTSLNTGVGYSDVSKLRSTTKSESIPPLKPSTTKIKSKLNKRDLWELVASTSDLISLQPSNGTTNDDESLLMDTAKKNIHDPMSSQLNVHIRLRKLDYYFSSLRIWDEECRLRLLCEVAKDPAKFSPLTIAFLDETRFIGDEKSLAIRLLHSNAGAKLLSYIEATLRGNNRKTCDVYMYRCPQRTESMINYETLLVWREMSKWLTVKMVTKSQF